jgi:hypothetical protein
MFGTLVLNWSSITMRPRESTTFFEVEAFDVWPAADGDEHNIGFELYRGPIMSPPANLKEVYENYALSPVFRPWQPPS